MRSRRFQRAVIVAMIAMRVMQVAIDQIVDVITMWHGLVPASRSMHMAGLMAGALMRRRAAIGVLV